MTLEEKIKNAKAILDVVKDYPEKLQEKVFVYLVGDDFPSAENNQVEDVESLASDIEKNQIPQKKRKKRNSSQSTMYSNSYKPQLVKDLNLRPEGKMSLADFINEKRPEGNIQTSAVMTYYLEKILNLEEINPDHIFTCYMELNKKIPAVIIQNLRDCSSSRYGYIDFVNGKITITVKGLNFVNQDLPHRKGE